MRYSGTLRSWNDERGFGFIAQAGGRADIFLHISELPRDGSRPTVGEKLTYALGRGKDGRPQAVNVIREAIGDTRNYKRSTPSRRIHKSRNPVRAISLILILVLGAYGYKRYEQAASHYPTKPHTLSEEVRPAPTQDIVPAGFNCDGRTHCSQMTSCTEAKLFLKNCPGVEMDGNHDGVPCEQQWCTSPSAK
jgi:cold shock CspA family protein